MRGKRPVTGNADGVRYLFIKGNWKLGMPCDRFVDSGVRHYMKTLRGDIDEPHYRGFVWNLLCAAWTAVNKPELNKKSEPVRSNKQ
jgi:hypothetical protein